MLYIVVQNKNKSESLLCEAREWQQNPKDSTGKEMTYGLSFESSSRETAEQIFSIFKTSPELFTKTHEELILEISNLREQIK